MTEPAAEGAEAPPPAAPARPADGPDWDAIRRDYETDRDSTIRAIADRHGVTQGSVTGRARREGWPPRRQTGAAVRTGPKPAPKARRPVDRADLIHRLYRVVARQVREIEKRVCTPAVSADERDARTLAAVARTLDLLVEIERRVVGDPATARSEIDLDALRQDLARRIRGLRDPGGGPGAADGPAG